MNKNFPGFLCLCLAGGLVALHRSKLPTPHLDPGSAASSPMLHEDQRDRDKSAFSKPARVVGVAVEEDGQESEARQESLRLIELRERAENDPEGAWAAALRWPEREGGERDRALAEVCLAMAKTNPLEAIERARRFDLGKLPDAIEERLVQQWASADVSAALAWLKNEPMGESRERLTLRITHVLSESDPVAAAHLVLEKMQPGAVQDEAVMIVVNRWANSDLVAAKEWVKDFPKGLLQERAARELEAIAERR